MFKFKNLYSLKISAQIKNIGTKYKINKERASSAFYLEHKYIFETYSQSGIGKNFQTRWGGLNFNVEGFFEDYFQTFDVSRTVASFRYDLGLFSILSAYSKNYKTFGMHFLSQNFDVGVTYMTEKNIGNSQKAKDKAVYLGLDINL